MRSPRSWFVAATLVAIFTGAAIAKPEPAPEWTPDLWTTEDTLQFRTDCPDEGEHWSYVWLVVIDKEIYVRLGSKAAARFDCNRTKPIVGIRIGDKLEFPFVEMVESPDKVEAVDAAMGDKYWTDMLIGFASHPYTMKLVPRKAGDVPAAAGAAGAAGSAEGVKPAAGAAGAADGAKPATGGAAPGKAEEKKP